MTRLYTKILAGQIPEPVPATQHLGQYSDSEDGTKPEKRKRGSSEEDPHYDPEMELTPPAGTTPNRRVDHKAAIVEDARRRAALKSPSEGACLVTGFRDKSIQCCHVVQRATYHSELKHLERSWALKEVFSLDSHLNLLFLRADLHVLWDRGLLMILPHPKFIESFYKKWLTGGDHSVEEFLGKLETIEVCVIPHKELWFRGRFTDAAPANKASICAGFAYGFDKLQFFKTHVRPHYLILNAGLKLLHKSRESWDENLQDFYKRKGIRADAWAILRYVRILCQMWTASTPPPFEKRSVKRQKVDNPLGPSSLPITPAPGIPKTPERRKAAIGPRGLLSTPPKPWFSGVTIYVPASLNPVRVVRTARRCWVSLQRNESIQGCHIVPRATTDTMRKHLAAWCGMSDFNINTCFNILSLRADIHILWDRGYIAFIPEPQVVEKCYKGSIVPIGVDLSCNDPLEVSKSPVYKYCIVVSSDLPQSEENTAFPRKLETSGWFKSHAPPQFFIYNIGSKLSKGDGGAAFLLSLDTFYKRHKIGYQAKLVFSHIEKAFSRWSTARRRQDNGLCS